jgi:hypothetical protein
VSTENPVPDRATELADVALDWINSNVARNVALKLTPLLLPVLGGAAVWLQDALGINMDPAEATAFVVAVVLGAAATATTWVRNHGRGAAQLAQAMLELEKLYEAGRQELALVSSFPKADDDELDEELPDFTDGDAHETGASPDYAGD